MTLGPRRRIVLIGVGHTHAEIIRRWADRPVNDTELVCIADHPMSAYSGMLPAVLGGQMDASEMCFDARRLAQRSGATFITDGRTTIDPAGHWVTTADGRRLEYDILSIGVGSVVTRFNGDNGVVGVKPMQDFYPRLISAIDRSDPSTGRVSFAIIGGGVAGIEIAFALRRRHEGDITIFQRGDRIAPDLTPSASRAIRRILAAHRIKVQIGIDVHKVEHRAIESRDGRRFAADIVIPASGATAGAWLRRVDLPRDQRGFLLTHPTLQSLGDDRVFAVGDCGTIASPDDAGFTIAPKAGVHAVRQSPTLWYNIRAVLAGRTPREFQPQKRFLRLINTGDRAIACYGCWHSHHRMWLKLKHRIDRRFMSRYRV